MSLTPAKDEKEARQLKEQVELCGKNRGTHNYIPIEWRHDHEAQVERVTRLMCLTCFANVSIASLIEHYRDVSLPVTFDN